LALALFVKLSAKAASNSDIISISEVESYSKRQSINCRLCRVALVVGREMPGYFIGK